MPTPDLARAARSKLDIAERRLAAFEAELAGLPPRADSDFEGLMEDAATRASLGPKIAFARRVADDARVNLARIESEVADREAKSGHSVADKAAEADIKLVHEVDTLVRKLAAARDRLAESVTRTNVANEVRGDLPYILDAEFRVRSRPGEAVEEIATWDDVNVDADGNPVAATIWDGAVGKHVPNPACVGTEKRKHVIRPAMQLPPRMPERFADALKLVDLAGKVL